MSKTKGTDILSLREIFKARGAEMQNSFLAKLTPELRELYLNIMATSWNEVEKQMAIYQAAAQTLFPGDADGMMRLGRALAEKTFSGIYKIFLRIPTVQSIFKMVARIWNTYYEKGTASIEYVSDKCVDMVVHDFPDLPKPMLEVAKGHYTVILELTGAKNINIVLFVNDPFAWRWRVTWK